MKNQETNYAFVNEGRLTTVGEGFELGVPAKVIVRELAHPVQAIVLALDEDGKESANYAALLENDHQVLVRWQGGGLEWNMVAGELLGRPIKEKPKGDK